jgi:hypothetical protein
MRIDYERLIAEVRIDCQYPDPHAPTDDLLMMLAGDVVQTMMNRLGNVPPGWSQGYFDLPVSANQPTYDITVGNFSKPVRIHTIDPGNPLHVTRKIDDCDWQNVDEFYRGPELAQASGHSARVMVLWREGAAQRVTILPTPIAPVQYRFWFNTGAIADPNRGQNTPIPSEFFRHLRVQVSSAVLGHCRWGSVVDKDRVNGIQDSLTKRLSLAQQEWDRFVLTNSVAGTTSPSGYADWHMNDWY